MLLSINLMAQPSGKKKGAKGYKVGDTATDFNLKNIDGTDVSLASIEGVNGYIVIFTSNVCPYAVMYEDRMIELHNKMSAKGYPVVAINSNVQYGDGFEDMQARAEEKGFPFLYLRDEGQKVYPAFGAKKTPHVFLLDKSLTVQYIGAIDDSAKAPEDVTQKYVEMAVEALNAGSTPEPSFTKAIGCPIKSAGSKGKGPKGKRNGPPSTAELFERMDENSDQQISKAEARGPLSENFDTLDTDGDGFLVESELKDLKPPRRIPNK